MQFLDDFKYIKISLERETRVALNSVLVNCLLENLITYIVKRKVNVYVFLDRLPHFTRN